MGVTARMALPVNAIGLPSAGNPKMPLFRPEILKRDATRDPSGLEKVSIVSHSDQRSLMEAGNPGLEIFRSGDIHPRTGDDEVLRHEAVDRSRITRRPHVPPEGFDKAIEASGVMAILPLAVD